MINNVWSLLYVEYMCTYIYNLYTQILSLYIQRTDWWWPEAGDGGWKKWVNAFMFVQLNFLKKRNEDWLLDNKNRIDRGTQHENQHSKEKILMELKKMIDIENRQRKKK